MPLTAVTGRPVTVPPHTAAVPHACGIRRRGGATSPVPACPGTACCTRAASTATMSGELLRPCREPVSLATRTRLAFLTLFLGSRTGVTQQTIPSRPVPRSTCHCLRGGTRESGPQSRRLHPTRRPFARQPAVPLTLRPLSYPGAAAYRAAHRLRWGMPHAWGLVLCALSPSSSDTVEVPEDAARVRHGEATAIRALPSSPGTACCAGRGPRAAR
jgi:hypothetical protein